jgi:RNA polymerase sigma-70 factor (ECF subfamily)
MAVGFVTLKASGGVFGERFAGAAPPPGGDKAMADDPADHDNRFPTTVWSEMASAWQAAVRGDQQALNPLLARYLPPLRAYLVQERQIDPHRADDLVQGFILDQILKGDLLARADRSRGTKFRTFLLAALRNYVISQWRADQAQKRRYEQSSAVTPEFVEDRAPPAPSPLERYELVWARQVLAEVMRQMRDECIEKGKPELADVFEGRFLTEPPLSYEQLVARFGFESPSQVSNAVRTARRTYERVLHGVLRREARDDPEVEELVQDLLRILSRGRV